MSTLHEEAEESRKQAELCLQVASRMSLETDRQWMTKMSQTWLELAELADQEAAKVDAVHG